MSEEITEDDVNPLKLVKRFYRSCKDMEKINKKGIDPVVEKIKFFGGWPVVKSHDWNESKWWWQKTAQDLELTGFSSNFIFSFGLTEDFKNTTRRILAVSFEIKLKKLVFLKFAKFDKKKIKKFEAFKRLSKACVFTEQIN